MHARYPVEETINPNKPHRAGAYDCDDGRSNRMFNAAKISAEDIHHRANPISETHEDETLGANPRRFFHSFTGAMDKDADQLITEQGG